MIKTFKPVGENGETIINKDNIFYKFIVAAAQDGEYNIVKFLLEARVDPNIKLEGKTCLQVAAENIDKSLAYKFIVKLLICNGADFEGLDHVIFTKMNELPSETNLDKFYAAIYERSFERAEILLKDGLNIDSTDIRNEFIIHAVDCGRIEIVDALIKAGVNLKDFIYKDLVSCAISRICNDFPQYAQIAKLLISNGADTCNISESTLELIMSAPDDLSLEHSQEMGGLFGLSPVESSDP